MNRDTQRNAPQHSISNPLPVLSSDKGERAERQKQHTRFFRDKLTKLTSNKMACTFAAKSTADRKKKKYKQRYWKPWKLEAWLSFCEGLFLPLQLIISVRFARFPCSLQAQTMTCRLKTLTDKGFRWARYCFFSQSWFFFYGAFRKQLLCVCVCVWQIARFDLLCRHRPVGR